jgi:hypothetical protein
VICDIERNSNHRKGERRKLSQNKKTKVEKGKAEREDKEEKATGRAEITGGRGDFGRNPKLIKESEENN